MNDYIFKFEDLPSTNTPYNAATFEEMQRKILDSVYPIGRGFIDFTDTDYSNYLGFTWERELVGLIPIGYNPSDSDFNQIGKTGGAKTHTLTVDEIPSEIAKFRSGADGNFNATYIGNSGNFSADQYAAKEFSIMPPNKVVAYWKRVA